VPEKFDIFRGRFADIACWSTHLPSSGRFGFQKAEWMLVTSTDSEIWSYLKRDIQSNALLHVPMISGSYRFLNPGCQPVTV